MKPKTTFLLYLRIGEHVSLVTPPWSTKKKCHVHFTSEKRALKYAAQINRGWSDYEGVSVAIASFAGTLPPFGGEWAVLKAHGLKAVRA